MSQEILFDGAPWWGPHWGAMPEYRNRNLEAPFKIVVNFATAEDKLALATLLGQRWSAETRYAWYPAVPPQITTHHWVSDAPEP